MHQVKTREAGAEKGSNLFGTPSVPPDVSSASASLFGDEDSPGLTGSDSMKSLEWYPWYPNRWMGSGKARRMTLEERGAYRELLDWQWLEKGKLPESIEDLSAIAGFDVAKYPRVLSMFPVVAPGIRANTVLAELWTCQQDRHAKRVVSANKRWEKKEIEEDVEVDVDIEGNAHAMHDAMHADFDAFWKAYPRKTGKKAALKAWNNAKDKPAIEAIIAKIEELKKSSQWKKDNGQFIPMPATWLNQGRWNDEVYVPAKPRLCV